MRSYSVSLDVFLLGNSKMSASFHLLNPNNIWLAQNRLRITLNFNMPLLFKATSISTIFQGTLRKCLISYPVLGNSPHLQETDDLHNFQFHRLEYLHIHCHYHSLLGLFHIYLGLYSNSKNSDILKSLIVTYFINFKKVQQVLSSCSYSSTASCIVGKDISLWWIL